jgi:hypothetical protein
MIDTGATRTFISKNTLLSAGFSNGLSEIKDVNGSVKFEGFYGSKEECECVVIDHISVFGYKFEKWKVFVRNGSYNLLGRDIMQYFDFCVDNTELFVKRSVREVMEYEGSKVTKEIVFSSNDIKGLQLW